MARAELLTIGQPCWVSDSDAFPGLDFALHLSGRPADRLIATTLYIDQSCRESPGSDWEAVGPKSFGEWFSKRPHLKVVKRERVGVGASGDAADRFTAQVIGEGDECPDGRLAGLPLIDTPTPDSAGDVFVIPLANGATTILVVTASTIDELSRVRDVASEVVRSIVFSPPAA